MVDVKLGVQIEPQFGYDFKQIYAILEGAEECGFSHAWFSDHFMMTKDSIDLISYEAFTAMMAAAAHTEKLRIGALVFCNSYRHPAVLAKQIASLDHFSNGRVEFGYGAGWKEIEYHAYGIDYPSAGVRIKQLAEGIDVLKKLWVDEYADYQGEYYQLNKAISYPKPLQKPYPPIWVGTMEAKPKMLELAAKYADGINIAWSFSPDVYQEKLERIDQFCEKYDRDPKSLMKSYGVWTRIYSNEDEKIEAWKKICEERGFTMEQLEKRLEGALHGTPEEILGKLRKYHQLGIDYFIFMFPKDQEIESMQIFKEKIIPFL
ncbi:MAG: LLM class flavin-dependent oxidoreductase [Candidatus Kariarchaeaceae archaeon]|jgi:alkanesulfonate monooxygenase SsuD/methylene tetrahydromethanopterin reductase-like flavin-dependent oxidoreductase (luciferase family)